MGAPPIFAVTPPLLLLLTEAAGVEELVNPVCPFGELLRPNKVGFLFVTAAMEDAVVEVDEGVAPLELELDPVGLESGVLLVDGNVVTT